ncbi:MULTISPECIES: DUF6234 family protein [unclassified Streptomyces]|uniref:DUF6234 family protein n=1 Tax=unclassified Streptomyces TaxID=2593676 RepID=UPI002E2D359D|nr:MULTISPECIES: DUF6234 family protein [unclassified Streptomyces]WUB88055.1 DUF6234 family protein [Streptomyces sp. NBC_00566]
MTESLPARRRRLPWSRRTRLGVDLAFAIPLFLLEIAWVVLDAIYGAGLEVWAAQGDQARIDAAHLAFMDRLQVLRIVVVVLIVLAAAFRARWTAIAHLLIALLLGGVLAAEQHDWERSHSTPGCVRYSANC